jgi:hypothetical protein
MSQEITPLRSFVITHTPFVDSAAFLAAMEDQIDRNDLDYRSRLLIRDGLDAVEHHWGAARLNAWLDRSRHQARFLDIRHEVFERVGFPSFMRRVMDFTSTETIQAVFRTIGVHLQKPVKMVIGGSIALMLPGLVSRHTEDIDVVDELPPELRHDHRFLASLSEKFGVVLAHFQSHYLPPHWENRTHWHGQYENLTVYLVDPVDVFVSKLFGVRDKDYGDLHVLIGKLNRQTILDRITNHCQPLLADASLRDRATKNWYTLTGEPLPT